MHWHLNLFGVNMYRFALLSEGDNIHSYGEVKRCWSNFFKTLDTRPLDEGLSSIKAKDCPLEPYIEFESEIDAMVFELTWG